MGVFRVSEDGKVEVIIFNKWETAHILNQGTVADYIERLKKLGYTTVVVSVG